MNIPDKPSIVESFGLPGAGKTALCRALGDRLVNIEVFSGKQFDETWRPLAKLGRRLVLGFQALSRPRLMLALIVLTWRLRLWRSGRALVRIGRLPLARAQLENKSGARPVLLDQALLQDVWSILLSADCAPPPAVLTPFLLELYRGITVQVLCLEIDVATAAIRISERHGGLSRFDGLPRARIVERLAKVEPMTRSVMDAARLSGLTIHSIDARQPPDLVVDAAIKVLLPTAVSARG